MMFIDERTLMDPRIPLANVELLARSVGVRMPPPTLSDYKRRCELVGRFLLREAQIRNAARAAAGAACIVALVVIGGVL